jgi:hypothetical protein
MNLKKKAWGAHGGRSRKRVGDTSFSVASNGRNPQMPTIRIAAALAAILTFSSAAFAQQPSQGTTSIPDFSGVWSHPYSGAPGFEPPTSGPGPVTNRSRMSVGLQRNVSNVYQLVGDYTNPILKPEAAEVVKKHGEISLRGVAYPTPVNQCWPQPVPFIFGQLGMQMLQQPDNITILYFIDNQVRHVRMNQPRSTQVTPSWYGDSIGRYEGDTLVIDTVGIKTDRPFAMADTFGTPYTKALHVVERYRLLDYEAAKEGLERAAKENFSGEYSLNGDRNYRGKHLQLTFTVEDEGVFTMPWSATITYGRPADAWTEYVCAENIHEYYANKDTAVPRADEPDF